MQTKKCFKCGEIKELDEFYTHKQMADGHLNKCKKCAKKDVNDRYYNPDYKEKISEYERKRNKTENRKKNKGIYYQKAKQKTPGKIKARMKLNYALVEGRIKRQPCEVCGDIKSEGHHKDYRKYLDVQWLCLKHHRELHKLWKKK